MLLSPNTRKSRCYIACAHRDAAWDKLRGDIPNGALLDNSEAAIVEDGTPACGLTVCNVPVGTGTIPFVRGYLKERKKKIVTGFNMIAQLLDPGEWPHPKTPGRQILWILTVACFQFSWETTGSRT